MSQSSGVLLALNQHAEVHTVSIEHVCLHVYKNFFAVMLRSMSQQTCLFVIR